MIVFFMLLASDSEEEPHCSSVTCEAAAKIPNLHTSFPTVFINIKKKKRKEKKGTPRICTTASKYSHRERGLPWEQKELHIFSWIKLLNRTKMYSEVCST